MVSDEIKNQARFWLEYSQQLSGTIRYAEALAAVDRALALDELSKEAWYAKGTYLGMLGRYDEALEEFEHALRLDEQYVAAWDGKAWVWAFWAGKMKRWLRLIERWNWIRSTLMPRRERGGWKGFKTLTSAPPAPQFPDVSPLVCVRHLLL